MSVFLMILVITLTGVSWRQTGFWKDDETIFAHTLEIDGRHNGFAHMALSAWSYEFPHDLTRCIAEFEAAQDNHFGYVAKYYYLYLIALGESDRAVEVSEKMRFYDHILESHYGRDIYLRICQFDMTLPHEELQYAVTYRLCRLAWLLSDKQGISAARELFAESDKAEVFNQINTYNYLKLKYFEMAGNHIQAEEIRSRLITAPIRSDYVQYRFMRKR